MYPSQLASLTKAFTIRQEEVQLIQPLRLKKAIRINVNKDIISSLRVVSVVKRIGIFYVQERVKSKKRDVKKRWQEIPIGNVVPRSIKRIGSFIKIYKLSVENG